MAMLSVPTNEYENVCKILIDRYGTPTDDGIDASNQKRWLFYAPNHPNRAIIITKKTAQGSNEKYFNVIFVDLRNPLLSKS